MKHHHDNFRCLKDATLEATRRARGGRTDMKVAGNPDVFKEAEGEEDYAKGDERKIDRRAHTLAWPNEDGHGYHGI